MLKKLSDQFQGFDEDVLIFGLEDESEIDEK
jgi:hypothetical protein